ncbi:yemanuclein isoform X2 [Aricia agestis]|uniref:yemanuclein isoform X2 n=1 Tax=Aricia agestis TaxID=91739 RepID=UPI001C2092B3|nr:yemanuclein isoform X2 [Aricia agestis]
MSDPKRATLITVGATKNVKNNVNKTVRLTINLDESNESKYPELNYKELVIATARKKRTENGKTEGLDPFSDNDDDVERVARKFEQKYGGKSTYGRKGRSKYDEFADIGAGYDENDSFIDNTDGYDEMIPPECDTLYGGFYINCGSLEFKTVPENVTATSDGEPNRNHVRNKRRISSSSSDDASSDSSSESDSQEAKDTKAIANGDVDSHKIEHRKKKNKDVDKKKAKKVRRTDSSAANSGKQTSDDNALGDAESADSRTSQSDSLTSKPAPSSENPITSDSSRDTEAKVEIKLPPPISQLLEEIEAQNVRVKDTKEADSIIDQYALRLHRVLNKANADKRVKRVAWGRASKMLHVSRARLLQRSRALDAKTSSVTSNSSQVVTASTSVITAATITTTETVPNSSVPTCKSAPVTLNKAASAPTISKPNTSTIVTKSVPATTTATKTTTTSKRKAEDKLKDLDVSQMSPEEKESKIVETLKKLKELIDERKPSMMSAYNAECERVQEERKKLAQYTAESGGPHIDKRLPKRRFPWCARSRSLLARLAHLAASPTDAAKLLHARALPLFPSGFVRMPTLLKQADLNKEVKASDVKFQRAPAAATFPQLPATSAPQPFIEPIQFPSSLTVTTTIKPMDKGKSDDPGTFTTIVNSFLPNKESSTDNMDDRKNDAADKGKEDYIRPNNIGSITITPVRTEKKINNSSDKNKEPLLRVKSPAALNEMVNKKDKQKKDKTNYVKEKSVDTPLHIDTGYQSKKESTQSPKNMEEISQKHIESMRIAENNIPRPVLVAKHSPTFAKPDKRPPDARKKKEVLIVSDMDPLADCPQEPLAVDDSSSDVEVIEDKSDPSEPKSDNKSDKVPSKDKVVDSTNHKNVNSVKQTKSVSSKDKECRTEKSDRVEQNMEEGPDDMMTLLRNITEMGNSQKPQKLNCNSFGGVINNAKKESSKYNQPVFNPHSDKDKLTSIFEQNGWM